MQLGPSTTSLACTRLIVPFAPFNAYLSMALLHLNYHIVNLSASLEISLSHQTVYYYLLDNLVSGPLFVPTVIAALHPSNRLWAPVCSNLLWRSQAASVDGKDLTSLPICWGLR